MLTHQQQCPQHLQQCLHDSPAASAVLGIPELFEHILEELDMRTLLTSAQRVNQYWRATITGSPRLQRRLFLQANRQSRPDSPCDTQRTINPLLAEDFHDWFHCPPDSKRSRQGPSYDAFDKVEDLIRRRNASWRRMHVTQPPVKKLGYWISRYCQCCGPSGNEWTFRLLEFPEGLRMGKLYDMTQSWMRAHRSANFDVRWTPNKFENRFFTFQVGVSSADQLKNCFASVDVVLRCGITPDPNIGSRFTARTLGFFNKRFAYEDR